jgi:hypothetical protein
MSKEDRLSGIERVIVERRLQKHAPILLERYAQLFANPSIEKGFAVERPLTEREQKLVSLVSRAANDFAKKYGGRELKIASRHVAVVPENNGEMSEDATGEYFPHRQNFLTHAPVSELDFVISIFHEMIHFLSYQVVQMTLEEKSRIKMYRTGFTLGDRTGAHTYFANLDEAIVEELTKRFLNTVAERLDARLRQEKKEIQDFVESGELDSFEGDEVVAVTENEDGENYTVTSLGYEDERAVLSTLIDKLYKANAGRFSHPDEIFDLFAQSIFTGHILDIARLVENTFGKGTFRKLGELDQDVDALKEYVGSL